MSRIISQHRPGWLVWLAGLALMGLTLHLGQWQRGRALEKEGMAAQAQAQALQPPLAVLPATMTAELAHRPVQIKGQWRHDLTVYLDNRPMHGRTGFLVMTPLVLAQQPLWVWVQRGWLPRDAMDRSKVPEHERVQGTVTVAGTLQAHAPRVMNLSDEQVPGPVQQNLPTFTADQLQGLAMWSGVVRELAHTPDSVDPDGLSRRWPAHAQGADKHWAYAFQWWALTALTGGLLLWFRIIRPSWRRRAPGPSSAEDR